MDVERPAELARLGPADEFGPALALHAPELLREFNRAGVLAAADVHVALTLGRLAGVDRDEILLAAALAVRAPRLGHVFVDLATIAETVVAPSAEQPLPWPAAGWAIRLAACEELIATDDDAQLPLRLDGTHLYLNRYWREELALAHTLTELAALPVRQLELENLRAAVVALFPEDSDGLQRAAAACMAMRALTVIAGGPGTGKTTTVARALALIFGQAAGAGPAPPPLVALCAPTGKAAIRLGEAVHEQASILGLRPDVLEQIESLRATTIHRLLGWRGAIGSGAFRHGPRNRLPHDIVIVDETSMVSLSLMASLLGAVRGDARVVLVGDPDQLAAVEAGAVLRDIVGPAHAGTRFGPGMGAIVARVTGVAPRLNAPDRWFGDGVITLRRGHRFGSAIGALADAIRSGDGDATLAAIAAGAAGSDDDASAGERTPGAGDDTPGAGDRTPGAGDRTPGAGGEIHWLKDESGGAELLRARTLATYREVARAATAGDGRAALAGLRRFQLLCAHRSGPYGVTHWTAMLEAWLADELDTVEPGPGHYVGEPLLLTANDHELGLYNGDAGVIVSGGEDQPPRAVFERDGQLVSLSPARLAAVASLYALTIHRSQGSQFGAVAVVLPEPDSPILTRELLYTAVTRTQRELILIGSEESLRAAVARPVARATGLQERLWGA